MRRLFGLRWVALAPPVAALAVFGALMAGCGSLPQSAGDSSSGQEVVMTIPTTTTALPATTTTAGLVQGGSTKTATVAGVTFEYPAAWSERADGDSALRVAEIADDLTAPRPKGARLLVRVASPGPAPRDTTDTSIFASQLEPLKDPKIVADMVEASVVVEPQEFQVGGKTATLVGLEDGSGGQSTIIEYVIIALGGGRTVVIALEDSSDNWPAAQSAFEAILTSIQFQA
jgi:hypothetical protein